MARARYYEQAQLIDADDFVKKVTNPEVTVYESGTTTPVADTIYVADTGGSTLSNPFTGGSDGTVEFYLDTPKRVSVKIDGASAGLGDITKIVDPGNLNTGLYSPDATQVVSVGNDGVFSAPGILRGWGTYFLGDGLSVTWYGTRALAAAAGAGPAAANAAAIEAAAAAIGTDKGGELVLPAGWIPTDPVELDTGVNGYPLTVRGVAGSSYLYFTGTTGPYLHLAPNSGRSIVYGSMRDVWMAHQAIPASGATLKISYAQQYTLDNVRQINLDADGYAPITSVEMAGSSSFLQFDKCTFITRKDTATLTSGGLVPVGLLANQSTGSIGGLEFFSTQFNGCATKSIGMLWQNTAAIDTVDFAGLSLVKDHATGMRFGFGSNNGSVANLAASGLRVDGVSGPAVHYTPTGTSVIQNHQYGTCWFYGADYGFLLDNSGAGTLRGIQVMGSYLTGGAIRLVSVGGVVSELDFIGNRCTCDATASGRVAFDIGDGSNAVTDLGIVGNRIGVSSASCDAVIRINAAVDSFTVDANRLRSGADADGIINSAGTGTSKIIGSNPWKA